MSTGVAQAATDTGLAQEWPREPDASAKEAQISKPGALACHKGDPPIPHGPATCDGGDGVDLTNLVMVDASGEVVGPVSTLELGRAFVIVLGA